MATENRLEADGGFGLAEAIMALSVLAIGILLTVTPMLSSMNALRRAKLLSIASNLAQAQVEQIRSLPYEDVGFPSSSPVGVLQPSYIATVQGIDWVVGTEINYVGAVTGLDVVPCATPPCGDGAVAGYSTGIDYKQVVVTISHPAAAINPVRFETISAPPNVGAHEGKAALFVALNRHDPFALDDPLLVPSPSFCLTSGTLPTVLSPTNDDVQEFLVIEPNAATAGPNYYYNVVLAPACGVSTVAPADWHILPSDLDLLKNQVHIGATQSTTLTLTVYRPSEIELTLRDSGGSPINNKKARLTLFHAGTASEYDENQHKGSPSSGVWEINTIDGYPVVPDVYDLTVSAEDYYPAALSAIQIPAGFPTSLTHLQDVFLTLVPGGTDLTKITIRDSDGRPINGADVILRDSNYGGEIALLTDDKGEVTAHLPQFESIDELDVDSPYNHDPAVFFNAGPASGLDVYLGFAGTDGLVLLDGGSNAQFGYRPDGASGDYAFVLPNDSGEASVALEPDTYDMVRICDDGTVAETGIITVTSSSIQNWGGSGSSC